MRSLVTLSIYGLLRNVWQGNVCWACWLVWRKRDWVCCWDKISFGRKGEPVQILSLIKAYICKKQFADISLGPKHRHPCMFIRTCLVKLKFHGINWLRSLIFDKKINLQSELAWKKKKKTLEGCKCWLRQNLLTTLPLKLEERRLCISSKMRELLLIFFFNQNHTSPYPELKFAQNRPITLCH